VKITDSNGCVLDDSFTLIQPDKLVLEEDLAQRLNINCHGESTGRIAVKLLGGVGPYNYTIDGSDFLGTPVLISTGFISNTFVEFENLKAGNYIVSVIDSNGCEDELASIELTQPSAPLSFSTESISNYNGFGVRCFGSEDGQITVAVVGGTAPYSFKWEGPDGFVNTTNLQISNLKAGDYKFALTDAKGCELNKTFTVTTPDLIVLDLESKNVDCPGEENGWIRIRSITGGTGDFTFTWTKDGNPTAIQRTFVQEDLRDIGPGRYALQVEDSNNCFTRFFEFTITEPPLLVINLDSKVDNKCFGEANGAISITVTGGTGARSFAWTGPDGFTSITEDLTNLKAGKYNLTVTDNLSCSQSLEVDILEPAEIILNEMITPVSCFGGSNGSITTAVTGGVGPFTYKWIGPNGFSSTNRIINGLKAGIYTLTIFDLGTECEISFPLEVVQPDEILLNETISSYNGFEVSCKGGSDGTIDLNITGGTPPYRVIWDGPNGFSSSLTSLSNLVAGTYDVAIIDFKNCTVTEKIILREPTLLLVSARDVTTTDVKCFNGTDGSLDVQFAQGSVPPYQYELSGTAANGFPVALSFSSNEQKFTFGSLRAGTYKMIITDANGCFLSEIENLVVTQPSSALSFVVQAQDVRCYQANDGKVDLQANGGTAPYTVLWNNGATTFSMENLAPGIYTAILKDANGCEIPVSTEVKEAPIFESTPEVSQISCFGEKDGFIRLKIVGGVAPVKVKWAHGPETPDLFNLSAGIYRATITDGKGCVIRKDFAINEPALLTLDGKVTDALDCDTPLSGSIETQVVGGTAPYKYQWSNGQISPNLDFVGPGNYSLVVTDARGCTVLKQFTIQRPLPVEIFSTQSSKRICNPRGLETTFNLVLSNGIPPYSVTWSRGTQTPDGLMMVTEELGLFTATVTDSRGCVFIKNFNVIETDPLESDFDYLSASMAEHQENLVGFDVNFEELIVGKYKEVQWEFGDGSISGDLNPVHKYKKAGEYTVVLKVKGLDGCIVKTEKKIIITDYFLRIPNVFTPDGDGINDYFFPKYIHIAKIKLLIMNKWGELIYASENLDDQGWDGLVNGQEAPEGNYVYKMTYSTLDGREFTESSTFLLAR
jgi:large repetitive protein